MIIVTLFQQTTGPREFAWSFVIGHSSHSHSGFATREAALAGARKYLGHGEFVVAELDGKL